MNSSFIKSMVLAGFLAAAALSAQAQEMKIGWDSGRPDYPVALKEILTRPV